MNSSIDIAIASYGSDRITTAGMATGRWFCVQALTDSVVTITGNIYGDASDIPLVAGASVYGDFTSLNLTSGQVLCYRRI